MRYFLAVLFDITLICSVAAQYSKTMSLVVTKITRTLKPGLNCEDSYTVLTLEAHSTSATFVLTCSEATYPNDSENREVCADFEPGTYDVRMLSPRVISFGQEDTKSKPGAHLLPYKIAVEEARTR